MSINIKPSKRGSLRKAMGAKEGDKLSVSKMRSKLKTASPAMKKKLQFALNARKWNHEFGGIIGEPVKGNLVVNNNQWIPQTRDNIYYDLANAGMVGSGADSLTLQNWNKLSPDETLKYMNPDLGFDYTIGNSANPGSIKYWRRDMNSNTDKLPKGFSDNYYKAKKQTAKLKKYEMGSFISPLDNINIGESFSNVNNLSIPNQLQGTNNPYKNKTVGNSLNLNGLTQGLSMASGFGSSMIDMFANPDSIENDKVNINEGAAAGKGALSGLSTGAMIGGPIGAGIGALVGGIGSLFGAKGKERRMQKQLDEQLKKKQFSKDVASRFSTLEQAPTYLPVARQGGFTVYKGETHEGPSGGILTDEIGNPSVVSKNKPIALTEKNEVARYEPRTGSTYIYSDTLGFAKPATSLVNKYKLNKDSSLYKNDVLLRQAVDKQFDNLQTAQEVAKEQTQPINKPIFKNGGELPMLQEGGNEDQWYLDRGYVKGPYGNWQLSPTQMEERFSVDKYVNPLSKNNIPLTDYSSLTKEEDFFNRPSRALNDAASLSFKKMDERNRLRRSGSKPTINNQVSNIKNNNTITDPILRNIYNDKINKLTWDFGMNTDSVATPKGPVNIATTTGSKVTAKQRQYNPVEERGAYFPEFSNVSLSNAIKPKQDLISPTNNINTLNKKEEGESFNPTLSPLGHILSGIGQIADYNALSRFEPEDMVAPRVGAQRIDLARQRLINSRNASNAIRTNVATARGLGTNAGATFSNIATANTGVSRLLGQQNMESLMAEEQANAQMQQQADMTNAEIGAQESSINTQNRNAYNLMKARMNPLGNLARTAAGYFADNAAYGQGYDTLQMLAPNAELYKDPESSRFKRPKIRLRDKK